MNILLRKALRKPTAADTIYMVKASSDLKQIKISADEQEYIKKQHLI